MDFYSSISLAGSGFGSSLAIWIRIHPDPDPQNCLNPPKPVLSSAFFLNLSCVSGVRESYVNLCSNVDDKLKIYRENFERAYILATESFYKIQVATKSFYKIQVATESFHKIQVATESFYKIQITLGYLVLKLGPVGRYPPSHGYSIFYRTPTSSKCQQSPFEHYRYRDCTVYRW